MDPHPQPQPQPQPHTSLPADAVGAPQLTHCFSAAVLLEPERDHGHTPAGQRLPVRIVGGRVWGPGLQGRVLPGGADWQLLRSDGVLELEAISSCPAAARRRPAGRVLQGLQPVRQARRRALAHI